MASRLRAAANQKNNNMKYDLTKCNNLRWKNGGYQGFIKTDGQIVCLLTDKTCMTMCGEMVHENYNDFPVTSAERWLDDHPDFEIVPRAPETYKDWQVGDIVVDKDGYCLTVGARLGDIVFLSCSEADGRTSASDTYGTCDEIYRLDFRLVLTDYEEELKKGTKLPFKDGDRVLLRASKSDTWVLGRFYAVNYDPSFPNMVCCAGQYKWCIPYNEKTWQLLGTTDNYKEE